MSEAVAATTTPGADAGAAIVRWLHGLLSGGDSPALGLPDLLAQLTLALGARRAGLVRADGRALTIFPADAGPPPWHDQPQLLAQFETAADTRELPLAGRHFLAAALNPVAPGSWLLWAECDGPASPGARAGLALAAQYLHRRQAGAGAAPRWARQLRRAQLEQDLEKAALVVRRLAHDYGNVLTSILGFSELGISHNSRDAAVQRYLQEIHRGAEQGAHLTNRLRLFARRVPLASVRPLNLAAALREEHYRLLGGDWPQRLRLQLDVPPDLPAVAVGQESLRDLLACLLDNAREAIPGEGQIVLGAAARTLDANDSLELLGTLPAGPCVELSVCDSGTGISPEVAGRLFHELFYTSKPRHRGLGLFVAYGLITAHRGGLSLAPAPGGGTVVRVYFPLAQTPAPVAAPTLDRIGRESILVVDDDPLILRMVCATLRRDGYEVAAAGSVREAQAAYRARPRPAFQLLLSDVVMPQGGGVELARELLSQDAGLRLLFMSGREAPDLSQPPFARRPIELLAKPFRPEGLLQAVRAALDRPAAPVE